MRCRCRGARVEAGGGRLGGLPHCRLAPAAAQTAPPRLAAILQATRLAPAGTRSGRHCVELAARFEMRRCAVRLWTLRWERWWEAWKDRLETRRQFGRLADPKAGYSLVSISIHAMAGAGSWNRRPSVQLSVASNGAPWCQPSHTEYTKPQLWLEHHGLLAFRWTPSLACLGQRLEIHRAEIANGRIPPPRIVEAPDGVEHIGARLVAGAVNSAAQPGFQPRATATRLMKSLRACWAVKRSCWTAAALLFDRPASRSRLRCSCFCSRRAVALWRCGAVALAVGVFLLAAHAGELEVVELAARAADEMEGIVAAWLDGHGMGAATLRKMAGEGSAVVVVGPGVQQEVA